MDGSSRSGVNTIQRPELPPLPDETRAARGLPDPFRGPAAGTRVEGTAAPGSASPSPELGGAVPGQPASATVQIVRPDLPPTPPALTPLAVANKSAAVAAQEAKKNARVEELRNARPQDKVEVEGTAGVPRPETPAAILALEQEKADATKGRKKKKKNAQATSAKAPKKKAAATKESGSNPVRLVVGLVVLALLAVLAFFGSQLLGGGTSVSDLAAGECIESFFQTDESGSFIEVSSLSTVACGQPHAYEVFAVTGELFASDTYPGVDASFTTGEEYCLNEYEEFIGGGRANLRTWEVWTFVPPEGSWSGDRVVQCVVGDINQATLVTGTLEGIAADS